MLIVSANDAARLLALDIAGGEAPFAELMNQQAAMKRNKPLSAILPLAKNDIYSPVGVPRNNTTNT